MLQRLDVFKMSKYSATCKVYMECTYTTDHGLKEHLFKDESDIFIEFFLVVKKIPKSKQGFIVLSLRVTYFLIYFVTKIP